MLNTKSFNNYLLLFVTVVGIGLYLLYVNRNESVVLSIEPEIDMVVSTPAPIIVSQISPDGTHTVSLKSEADINSVIVNDQVIATIPSDSNVELSIPFNTWSPDNKYFFIKEKKDDGEEFLVMSKAGQVFADESLNLKVVELFATSHPDITINDVTGWAAPNLLIINARSDKESKMSFWFEVTTRKFIRLSNYFY